MTDDPTRLRIITSEPTEKSLRIREKRLSPSGRKVLEQPFICSACNETALIRLRLGARDVNGKLRGGEDWWCCAGCRRAWYRIKGYD